MMDNNKKISSDLKPELIELYEVLNFVYLVVIFVISVS